MYVDLWNRILRTVFVTQTKLSEKQGNYYSPKPQYSSSFFFIKMPRTGKLFQPRAQVPNFVSHSNTYISNCPSKVHSAQRRAHILFPCGLHYSETYTLGNK